jgi:hypothetical protein
MGTADGRSDLGARGVRGTFAPTKEEAGGVLAAILTNAASPLSTLWIIEGAPAGSAIPAGTRGAGSMAA